MNVLFRNFTKLLSIGVFNTDDTLEPMSEFKWNKLLVMANNSGVNEYIGKGIAFGYNQAQDVIPNRIYETTLANMPTREKMLKTTIENYDRYNFNIPKQQKMFSNVFLNRKYNKIVYNEIHNIDTSLDSLVFIHKLIENINTLLDCGIDFGKIADLGLFLRQKGDKIDFVKIENWIKLLKIRNIADIVCLYLIVLFHFEKEELPFIKSSNKIHTNGVVKDLADTLNLANKKYGGNAKTKNSLAPISKPNTHPLKYFKHFPLETSTRMITNAIKSLSNIDE